MVKRKRVVSMPKLIWISFWGRFLTCQLEPIKEGSSQSIQPIRGPNAKLCKSPIMSKIFMIPLLDITVPILQDYNHPTSLHFITSIHNYNLSHYIISIIMLYHIYSHITLLYIYYHTISHLFTYHTILSLLLSHS